MLEFRWNLQLTQSHLSQWIQTKIFAVVYDFFQHITLTFACVLVRHVKRMADPHASWTPHQHLYLPSLYSVHFLSIQDSYFYDFIIVMNSVTFHLKSANQKQLFECYLFDDCYHLINVFIYNLHMKRDTMKIKKCKIFINNKSSWRELMPPFLWSLI